MMTIMIDCDKTLWNQRQLLLGEVMIDCKVIRMSMIGMPVITIAITVQTTDECAGAAVTGGSRR